jgi:branched-chain amino acid transport system permease protein
VAAIIAVPLFRLRNAYFSIAVWIFVEIIADKGEEKCC